MPTMKMTAARYDDAHEAIGLDDAGEIHRPGERFGLGDHGADQCRGSAGGDGVGAGKLNRGDQPRAEGGLGVFDHQGDLVIVGAVEHRAENAVEQNPGDGGEIDGQEGGADGEGAGRCRWTRNRAAW